MSDSPFVECLNAFAAHDYQRAANLGVNLLESGVTTGCFKSS